MINKLQSGGTAAFVTYTPFTGATSQQVSTGKGVSSSEEKSDSKLTDKDLMNMIKEIDGLPSDMEEVLSHIQQLTMTSNLFGANSLNNLTSTYLKALGEVKKATWNKKQYDAAYKVASENGSLSEVAITQDGRVYVQDDNGNPKIVTVNDYMSGKYNPLTNSNLLYLRAHDSNYANTNQLFSTVENGIGMEAVTKLIQQGMEKLGSSELERTGYTSLDAQKGLKILQEVQQRNIDVGDALSLNGLYETKVLTKNQVNQAQQALEYIWRMLPNNARTLLSIKSGNSENPAKGAFDLLTKLVISNTSDTFKFDPQYKQDLNSDGSKKSEDGGDGVKMNQAMQFVAGLGESETFPISLGTTSSFQVNSTRMPITKENNPIGANASLQKVTQSDFGGMMNTQSITMGGKLLNSNALNYVITDGFAHSIDLPIDMEAAEKGIIKPDLSMLKALDEADKYIRENGIKNPEEINRIYRERGIPAKFDKNGELNLTNYTRFMVVNAKADARAFKGDVTFEDTYLTEVMDDKDLDSFINSVRSENNFKDKEYDPEKVSDEWFWIGKHDAIYESPIFIPMNTNVFNNLGQSITGKQMQNLSARQKSVDAAKNYINPNNL